MNQALFTKTRSTALLNSTVSRNHARPDRIPSASGFLLQRLQHSNRIPASTVIAPTRQRLRLQVFAAVKKSSKKSVACSKTLVVLPGKETEAETLCQQVVNFSKNRMADRSNGIISFDCSKVKTNRRPSLNLPSVVLCYKLRYKIFRGINIFYRLALFFVLFLNSNINAYSFLWYFTG